jgi:hypothetical protein
MNGIVKEVAQPKTAIYQNLLSVGLPKRFASTIPLKIMVAIERRMPSDSRGGIVSSPSFIAAHDVPHSKQMIA